MTKEEAYQQATLKELSNSTGTRMAVINRAMDIYAENMILELQTQNTNLLNSLESINEERGQLALKVESLSVAVQQSVKLIEQWHSRSIPMAGKLKAVVEDVWETYYEVSDDMKLIREVLKEE